MEERRKVERFPMLLQVRWETAHGASSGVILNGSAGGCFVRTRTDDPGDDPLRLEIRLPGGERLSLWGEVTYYLPTEGFGLQFIGSPDDGSSSNDLWLEHLALLKSGAPVRSERALVSA
ncbi:MAG TPA: PilZ domain-containing protein [Pyrinomonadaceae bacterium]|jgi:hypothetical protein|nr:PilZ domain-containing protein [Pyrinomonadaceae bacterium]